LRLLLHQALELGGETPVTLLVVGPVGEHDVALPVERHAIVRIGQVLRGEPEVERVPRHEIERPARRDGGRAGPERVAVQLAYEGDVAHRVLPDRKSTRLNSSHVSISYAVFCLKKKKKTEHTTLYMC